MYQGGKSATLVIEPKPLNYLGFSMRTEVNITQTGPVKSTEGVPRDIPIIFAGPMVQALLSGRKTMTRRLATSPLRNVKVGDRLWVREAHAFTSWDEDGQFIVDYLADDARSKWLSPDDGDVAQGLMERLCSQFDRAGIKLGPDGNYEKPARRFGKPSIHMPRWASRLTLIVTGSKVERLQEISRDNAIAEGATSRPGCNGFRSQYDGWSMNWSQVGRFSPYASGGPGPLQERDVSLASPQSAFGEFINVLHDGERWNLPGKPTPIWEQNPEVVAISFEVVKANIDVPHPTTARKSPDRSGFIEGGRG